jgi:hypothetical protein
LITTSRLPADGSLDDSTMVALARILTMMGAGHHAIMSVYYRGSESQNCPADSVRFEPGGLSVSFWSGAPPAASASLSLSAEDRHVGGTPSFGGRVSSIVYSGGEYSIGADGKEFTLTTTDELVELMFLADDTLPEDDTYRQITPQTALLLGAWVNDQADGHYVRGSSTLAGGLRQFGTNPGLLAEYVGDELLLTGQRPEDGSEFRLALPIAPGIQWKIDGDHRLTVAGPNRTWHVQLKRVVLTPR